MMSGDFDRFEKDFNEPVLEKDDLIWQWGKFDHPDWDFIGIPATRWTPALGVSYYFVTGDEDPVTHARLVELVS